MCCHDETFLEEKKRSEKKKYLFMLLLLLSSALLLSQVHQCYSHPQPQQCSGQGELHFLTSLTPRKSSSVYVEHVKDADLLLHPHVVLVCLPPSASLPQEISLSPNHSSSQSFWRFHQYLCFSSCHFNILAKQAPKMSTSIVTVCEDIFCLFILMPSCQAFSDSDHLLVLFLHLSP